MALLFVPYLAMAQSEWELPESAKAKQTEKQKKVKSDVDKQKTDNKAQKAAKPLKMKIDAKYAAGTVPEVDGKVTFEETIKVPGMSADVLYDRVLNAITDITKEPKQHDNSRISAVNKHEHIVAASLTEEMIFSHGALAKDFTDFKYTLIATCHDGSVDLKLFRISYEYEKERETHAVFTAEDWITDKEALNKKGTNLYRGNGKFRKKTIDRKDEVFAFIKSRIKD